MAMTDILISLYNYEQYVEDCIKSCLAQTNCKIILVDDCSTDSGLKVAEKYSDQIKIIALKENKGVSHARNVALKASSSEYIQILDADDMLTPNSIEERMNYFAEHPNVDVVGGETFKERGDRSYEECVRDMVSMAIHPGETPICSLMFKRSVFEEFGLFYEGLRTKEDKAFHYKIGLHRNSPMKTGIKFKKIAVSTSIVRRHGQSKRKIRGRNMVMEIDTHMKFDAYVKYLECHGLDREVRL